MTRSTPRLSTLAAALALTTAVLAGCASPAGIQPTGSLAAAASLGATAPFDAWPQTDWWTRYQDPQLDALVARALQGNLNIQLAQSRLAKARAATELADAARYPQVGADLEVTRQRFSATSLYPPPLGGAMETSGQAVLSASYEIDFWGKHRAALDAALSQTRAAEAEAQAARVIVASSVARGYFNLARLVEQRDVAQAILAQRAQTLQLVQQRVAAGLDTRVELKQAEGNLPLTRGDIAQLDEQIALARNALAALIGDAPQATQQLAPHLQAHAAAAVPASLPADLIGHRADVAAAKARVLAAGGEIGVARAQFYPNVNLTAFAGYASLGLSRLFDSGSETYGVGPAITLPIFDAGRLRANLKGKTADFDAAVQSYHQAVLDAARDVADQVASLQALQVQQREQQAAQAAAETAYDLATQRYKAGLANYLTVLTAENAVLAQRRAATDLSARALELDVALNRALGGGYTAPAEHAASAH